MWFLKGDNMSSIGITRQDATKLMRERSQQIYDKLKSGETEEAIVTGGNAFTQTVWDKMLESVDDYLTQVKEDQQVRFAQMDEKREETELLLEQQDEKAQEEKRLEEDHLEKMRSESNALREKLFREQEKE